VILGSVAFCILGFACGWNFQSMFGDKFVTAEISVDEEFGDISINTDTIDIFFEKSKDDKAKVFSYDKEKLIYKAEVKDGVLEIGVEDRRAWFEKIFNMTFDSRLTVYLPEGEYGSLDSPLDGETVIYFFTETDADVFLVSRRIVSQIESE
jgi:hypothetical protein